MAAPCMNDRPHLFLTGEKGVGKSTLLRKLLGERTVSGFYTVKTIGDKGISLHLISGDEVPDAGNFLCFCPPGQDAWERFDTLGCAALERRGEVIVMDELGPAEERAKAFRAAVLRTLEGEIPVLGVLQKGDYSLYREVAGHRNVYLVEVTAQNRDSLAAELILPVRP